MEKRRVLMIAYHFPPELEVGALRTARFAKYLPANGWEPIVLSVNESYYDACDPTGGSDPGVPVYRTPMAASPREILSELKSLFLRRRPRSHGGTSAPSLAADQDYVPPEHISALRRVLLSLVWLPDDRQGWIAPATAAAVRLVKKHKIDVLYSTGPPWSNQVVGLFTALITRKPWVADFRDPWAGGRFKPFFVRSSFSEWADRMLERSVARRASRILCMCDRQRDRMLAEHPKLSPEKVLVLPNGFDPDEYERYRGISASKDRWPMTFTYAGKFYHGRDPGNLLAAARQLLERGTLRPEEARFRFLGRCGHVRGMPLKDLAERTGVGEMVEIPGELPRTQCLEELRRSDVLLLLAMEQKDQVPAKVYEYLMMEKPILAFTEEDSATAEVVRRTGAGIIASMDDLPAVTAALDEMVRRYREGSLAAQLDRRAVAGYAADSLTRELAETLESALNWRSSHARAGSRPESKAAR